MTIQETNDNFSAELKEFSAMNIAATAAKMKRRGNVYDKALFLLCADELIQRNESLFKIWADRGYNNHFIFVGF